MHPNHTDDMNVNGFFDDLAIYNDAGPDLKNILIGVDDYDIAPEIVADEIGDMISYLQDGTIEEDMVLYKDHEVLLDVYVKASNAIIDCRDANFFRRLMRMFRFRYNKANTYLKRLETAKSVTRDFYYKKLYVEIKNISVLIGLIEREFNKFKGFVGVSSGGISC